MGSLWHTLDLECWLDSLQEEKTFTDQEKRRESGEDRVKGRTLEKALEADVEIFLIGQKNVNQM